MDVFTIVAVVALALGLVAVHVRLSPLQVLSPAEPLAHPDLIGFEDIADEAARPSLGPEPEEATPPRPRRAAMLLEAHKGSEERGAS